MKPVLKTLTFLFFSGSLFLACEKSEEPLLPSDEGVGNVSFSFDASEENNGRTANGRVSALVPNQIMLTIKSADTQEVVYDKQVLDVIAFNGNYISDPISLKVGAYELVEYFVLDVNGTVIYLTPLAGSELAYLVDAPLAIGFDIAKDDSKQITPEVITPEGYDAADFGYTDFDFDVVTTIDFLMSVHFFDEVSESYELTDAFITISGDGTELYQGTLDAKTNQIRLRDGFASYELIISKVGFGTDTLVLSTDELKAYLSSPLILILDPKTETVGQEQTKTSSCSGGIGQSFTPAYTGELSAIEVRGCSNWAILTLNIFEGEGMDGNLLHSQEVHLASPAIYKFTLSTPISITAGQVYTMEFINDGSYSYAAWYGVDTDYTGGQGYINGVPNTGIDWWFKTYIYK